MRTPNHDLRAIVRAYCASAGLDQPMEAHYAAVDEAQARRIAAEYEALPTFVSDQPGASVAYYALAREIEMQFDVLRYAGYTFTFTAQDPYASSDAMFTALAQKQLRVFAGGDAHPYFTQRINLLFRAVHDCFGHAAEGYQWGARGEENAWIHHSMMFSPLAQAALTSETRGQNSWVNFGPYASLPVGERPFAAQKAALLPAWAWDWRSALTSDSK
jgi:hypothetical protein